MTGLTVRALLIACASLAVGASEEAKLGAPAPGLSTATGRLVLVVNGDGPSTRRLRSRGIDVVLRETEKGGLFLLDEAGILRRRGQVPATADRLLAFVTEWEAGRTVFQNRCARCHGEDGMDKGYPFIEQLGGIGNRHTIAEIRQKLRPTLAGPDHILVRGEPFSKTDFETLLVFIAGL